MAIFRNVNMTFWTDTKVTDNYTPEDRYFMLWALTNNYTNIIGCYEVSIKQISNDLGYNKDVIDNLIKRFKEIHKTIDYDYNTNELLVINWNKFNWSTSPKLDLPLYNAIKKVKSNIFHNELALLFNNRLENTERIDDTVLIPYRYGIDTTIAITSTIPIPITITNNINNNKEDLFELFWKVYPKKIAKGNAEKWFNKNKPNKELVDKMILQIKRFKDTKDWKKENGQFIPYPTSWLNAKMWEDEFETETEKEEKLDKEIMEGTYGT